MTGPAEEMAEVRGAPVEARLPDLSVLVVSRSVENLLQLTRRLEPELPTAHEVLCSWNGEAAPPEVAAELPLRVEIDERRPYHFATNCNALARRARGALLLFVNDDIRLDPGALRRALRHIRDDTVGIVGANLRFEDGRSQHAGVFFHQDGAPFHRFKGARAGSEPDIDQTCFVPAVTGAFMLMRREEFLTLGLDEGFSVAGEDIVLNLSYRARFNRGILYAGDVTALHVEGATRKTTGERVTPPNDLARLRARVARFAETCGPPNAPLPARLTVHGRDPLVRRAAGAFGDLAPEGEAPRGPVLSCYLFPAAIPAKALPGIMVTEVTADRVAKNAAAVARAAAGSDHCVAETETIAQALRTAGLPPDRISVIARPARPPRARPVMGLGPGSGPLREIVTSHPGLRDRMRVVSAVPADGTDHWPFAGTGDFYAAIDYLVLPDPERCPEAVREAHLAFEAGAQLIAPRNSALRGLQYLACPETAPETWLLWLAEGFGDERALRPESVEFWSWVLSWQKTLLGLLISSEGIGRRG